MNVRLNPLPETKVISARAMKKSERFNSNMIVAMVNAHFNREPPMGCELSNL